MKNLVYGVKYFLGHSGQSAVFYPGQDGYKLFAHRVDTTAGDAAVPGSKRKKRGKTKTRPDNETWVQMLPVRIRAMTKADGILFVAGVPDVVDDHDPLSGLEDHRGAVLRAYSAGEGHELTEIKLAAPPVFDGLVAANGKLYMTAVDGSVICMGE